ncbi:MAG: glycoside hydrolase family 28 protein [Bacteroidales bacterium]|nr:glycoside hydrolase family 28 protein [Bacteroidales bacterium]
MKYISAFLLSLAILTVSCKKQTVVWQGIFYESVLADDAPFHMTEVLAPIFPDRNFDITNYGARPMPAGGYASAVDSSRIIRTNSQAIERAMNACSASGGGHVVVPKGEWLTGIVVFSSNCDLYLSEGAELVFSANPDDYLPEHMTTYEGIECYNYRPLIYAWRQTNLGISGTGTIRPLMSVWEKWFEPTPEHSKGLQILDRWGTFNHIFYQRSISSRSFKLSPPLIQFYQCTHILLQDFKVRQSPHWTVHCFGCEEGVIRRLDLSAHGRKNDGIDLEMTRHFIVEDCVFDQGGDAISIKSGRVHETWNNPDASRFILIRRCEAKNGKAFLSIGEEMSHGAHFISMHDCKATGDLDDFVFVKTNKRQEAEVDSIFVENCEVAGVNRVFALEDNVWGDWRDVSSSGKDTVATIGGIIMRDVKCRRAVGLVEINGPAARHVKDITIQNVHADSLVSFVSRVSNADNVQTSNLTYRWFGNRPRP